MSNFKQYIKRIFKIFGFDIHKIRFERDKTDFSAYNKTLYCDKKEIIKEDKNWQKIENECKELEIPEDIKRNPFSRTKRVAFELSNLCNYSKIHIKCPLSLTQEPKILPASIVYNVLDSLKRYNFEGEIAFHNYNEPLIDPRLFKFIEYARQVCPKSRICICTNGFYFTQTLADELVESGVTNINISVYSKKEMERLSKIHLKIAFRLSPICLFDYVIPIYNSPKINNKRTCSAPLNEVIISKDGEVVLCCLDWKKVYTFGSLKDQKLEDILKDPKIYYIYQRLKKGDRFLNICSRCPQSR